MSRAEPQTTGQSLKQGGRVVNHNSVAYVGIDTSKLRNAVAVAEKGVAGTFGISAKSTPRKRGDAQARYQTCGQIPSAAGGRPLQDEDHRRCHRLRVGGALNQPGQYPDRLLSAPSSFLSICSQLHTEPHCLLMRGPQATLESAGNHSRFDPLARERLQHADIFLCPRSDFRRLLRHPVPPTVLLTNHRPS